MGERVCLIMCFRDEAENLPAVLASLAAQTFDRRRLFLVAVDDGSSDDGARIIERWLEREALAGKVIRMECVSIPVALNRTLEEVTRDDYVVRLDAHTIYEPRYIEILIDAFAKFGPNVWCVGTKDEPLPTSDFSKALHASLLESPMGLGSADFRASETVRPVASVYLGAWRPGILQRLGGYDVRWAANEDAELAQRARLAGGVVMRVPARAQKMVTRGALTALKQWSRYGFWRAQTLKRHPAALRPRHLAPILALFTALALLASPARLLLVPLYMLYAALIVAYRPRHERWTVTLATLFYFPFVHCGNALGTLTGLIAARRREEIAAWGVSPKTTATARSS